MTIYPEISEIEEPIAEKRVWSFWPTVGLGAVVLAVSFIIQVLVVVIVISVQIISDMDFASGMVDFEEILNATQDATIDYLGLIAAISVGVGAVVCTGLILLFIKARRRASIPEYLGLGRITVKTALAALGITAVFIALTVVINVILDRPEQEITLDLYTTSVWPLLLWIAVVILGPIFEEALFRGFLFEGFRQSRVGAIGAIVITSVVFASLHIQYDIYSMGQILVLGIILGIVRWKTGSLWGPLLIHALNNLLAMILVALAVNGV